MFDPDREAQQSRADAGAGSSHGAVLREPISKLCAIVRLNEKWMRMNRILIEARTDTSTESVM